MNFTPELSAFQGVLLSADNVHQFSRLADKGGNEDQINYVVNSILTYLKQSQYIINEKIPQEKVAQTRKFAFYIVLNAELMVLTRMVDQVGIDSVIWTIPTIPLCLMCELLWNLHMEPFIQEIISYTYPPFALEVAAAFTKNFRYFDPLECLDQLRLLSTACYTAICRLNLFNFENHTLYLLNISKTAYHNFQNCIKYFTAPPNDYKLNRLGKDELYKYLGKRLHAMFSLIDDCLTIFTSKLEPHPPVSDLYESTFKEGCLLPNIPSLNTCEFENNILVECLNNCHTFMLDICKDLVMEVSVDVFCCWSEIEENGKSMQQTVGELCYKVRSKLMKVTAEHPLISMIQQICRKPIEMHDIINATEFEVILRNINKNDEESVRWISALVHKENVCLNIELLKVIESNLDKYDNEEHHKLYTKLTKHVNTHFDHKNYIEMLSLKVFQQCNQSTKYSILNDHFCNSNFVNTKETSNFGNSMTEIFNKLVVAPDADLTDILTVFIQNPQQVFLKIFTMATESAQQTDIMLKVMKLLEKYANYYYNNETEPCIIKVTQEVIDKALDSESKENNFVKFVCGLKGADIISGSRLLLTIIMTNIHKSLLSKDGSKISIQVKLLRDAYSLDELLEYRAPMLAMIAQILDILRWKINTFSSTTPLTMEAVLSLQKSLFNTYDGTIPENESSWLKSRLVNMQPLNMYYFRDLWNPPGSNYLEIVSGIKVEENMNTDELTSWLSQVLCSCILDEWYELWDSLSNLPTSLFLKAIIDPLALIILAEQDNRTDKSRSCLLYCYKNFVMVIRYKYFKEPLTDSQVKEGISSLATLAELISSDMLEEFGPIVLPLFAYLSERKDDHTVNISDYIQEECSSPIWKLVNKLFSNGSA